MLYGTLEQQKEVLDEAQAYAEKEGLKLIFGAMVGSVSKGMQYANSDYDTRFLYLRDDFPDKICVPSQMREDELVKRYYPEGKIFEWIPFWEATSFLQFLHEPSFKDDFSVGLYNIVGWTLQSPYIWDPYGIQNKIMPLVNLIFRKDYEIAYHRTILKRYKNDMDKESVITRVYLDSVHAAATIEWCNRYNQQPPIDLKTLLYGLDRADICDETQDILETARREARENRSDDLSGLHWQLKTRHSDNLTSYVKQIWDASSEVPKVEIQGNQDIEMIERMNKIIYQSVFENEEMKYGGERR